MSESSRAEAPAGRRAADLAFALFCLVVATMVWLEARTLPEAPFDPLGPGSVPLLLAGLLGGLALLLLLRMAMGRRVGVASQSLIVGMGEPGADHPRRPWLAVVGFASTVAYVAVMQADLLDFVWATMIYLAALGMLLLPPTRRARLIGLAIAVLGAIGLQLVFSRVLFVDLP